MNATTKQRYISTSIWDDDWFDSLTEREKLVYFYLLTNPHTNAAGVYQCTLKNMRLEIGLEREEAERIMSKFGAAGKAFYFKDYIIIPKWLRHQKIKERSGLFLGMVKVLKSLPDEIKAFISDRQHYDYDVSGIIGIVSRPTVDPPSKKGRPSQDPPPKIDTPSIEFPVENGEHPPQTTAQKPHDLDFDLDLDSDLDLDIDSKEGVSLSAYFIKRWQGNADIFNCLARIKQPAEWKAFWEKNSFTLEQIDTAINNFIEGVKSGDIQRRYIPSSPDGFIINGWLSRSQTPFKKQTPGHRIANDNVPEDDVSKYFTEV